MKGVSFLGYHSFRDLHILLTGKEIGSPEVKRQTIDIEGADGELDFTDFFGEPKYSNAQHRFEFESIQPWNEQLSQFADIKNKIHGKKGRIVLDSDPSFFYVGRCFVSSYKNEATIGRISIECDCEPYKYKMEKTVVTQVVDGTQTITLTNARKRAVPTITTTSDMTISFGGGIWTNRAGTFTIPELELVEGDNLVTVTGAGNITFTWQEAML
jgi:phage-related protein